MTTLILRPPSSLSTIWHGGPHPFPKVIGYLWVRYPNPRESWRPKTGSSGLYSPSSAALHKFHTPANKVFWFYLISFTLFNRSQPVVESKFSKVSRQLRTVPIKKFKTVLSDSTLDSDLHFKFARNRLFPTS